MPAGLTVFNDSGSVQVDENWKNYGFRNKFSVPITAYGTSPPNPAGYNGMPYGFTTPGSPQLLIACKASTLMPVKLHSYYDAGSWNFNYLMMPPTQSTYSETVEFYVFDAMDSSYSNVGMEVFNAAGQRVYHTDAPVMKYGGVRACNSSFLGAPGRTYVPIILANPLVSVNMGGGIGNRLFSYGLRSVGSNIQSDGTIQLGAFGATAPYTVPGLYAAVDVTGL